MSKREVEESSQQNSPASKKKAKGEEPHIFVEGTTETNWSPENGERNYILRYIHGETCCESPYANEKDWPIISYSALWSEDEPDEDPYNYELSVIGAVWVKESGKFIGFWGADEGDGHVYFCVSKDFEHVEELEPLSGILSTEICPELIDVFDDGSGKDREPRLIDSTLFEHDVLSNLYKE